MAGVKALLLAAAPSLAEQIGRGVREALERRERDRLRRLERWDALAKRLDSI